MIFDCWSCLALELGWAKKIVEWKVHNRMMCWLREKKNVEETKSEYHKTRSCGTKNLGGQWCVVESASGSMANRCSSNVVSWKRGVIVHWLPLPSKTATNDIIGQYKTTKTQAKTFYGITHPVRSQNFQLPAWEALLKWSFGVFDESQCNVLAFQVPCPSRVSREHSRIIRERWWWWWNAPMHQLCLFKVVFSKGKQSQAITKSLLIILISMYHEHPTLQ